MVVHHVEMNQIGAGGEYALDFLTKTREVG
jgi:hypothetical protein